ncbi:MAG TPA: oligosaccharide flippase family protein [Steroidobacteraceae bacterium]|nr:oligosaccharide flippase family protein [Steroidobacteraceae bacterium]
MTGGRPQNRIFVGSSWLIGVQAVERLIGLVSIAFLARLLTPRDFGVVAVAMTVVAAVELTSAFGFDWALVRHRDLSAEHLNSAWTLRVLMGLVSLAALALLGPVAADFYRLPALRWVLPVLGLSSFLGSLENIGTVFFRRDFTFHNEFLLRVTTKLSGFIVSISLAFAYRSYWALVAGTLALRASGTAMSYLLHPYRPGLSLARVRELFAFSSWILLGKIVDYCTEKFSNMYVGRVYGPHATGLLAVSSELSGVPVSGIAAPINRVAYSKYAEDVRANRSLKSSYLEIASIIWTIALPLCAGLIGVVAEAVRLVLGPRWEGADTVVTLFSVATAFGVMTANTHYVYWALGRSKAVAMLSALSALLVIPSTIICSSYYNNFRGAALAWVITSAVLTPVNFTMLRRFAGISFLDLWRRVWRVCLGAVAMLVVLLTVLSFPVPETVSAAALQLLLKVLAGATVYVGSVTAMWLACGRPEGPESRMLQLALQFWKGPLGHAAKS